MGYVKYELDVNPSLYAEYEKVRKENLGNHLNRNDMEVAIFFIGLPEKSPKVWQLLLKYELVLRYGKASGTYYTFPKEQPPYSRFQGLENDFYNGIKPKKPQPKPVEKETNRVVLDEDYCLRYLKERGYMCFKLTPNLMKLQQIFTPQFLIENCDAELK